MNNDPQRRPLYLLALLGQGIQGSLSPQLYEQEARRQGLRCAYQLLDFTQRGWADDRLPEVLDSLALLGFTGCNITHPFKQQVIPWLDELSAQSIPCCSRMANALVTTPIATGLSPTLAKDWLAKISIAWFRWVRAARAMR